MTEEVQKELDLEAYFIMRAMQTDEKTARGFLDIKEVNELSHYINWLNEFE